MANLSNINGKFVVEQTTGYVGVGTTDPNFLIEAAGANSEIALNSTSASIYRLRSTSSDSFIITKNGVGDRLTINGGGDATFAGNVTTTAGRLQLGAVALPSAGVAAITNRSTDNSLYIQTSSGNTAYLLDGSQNTMYSAESTAHNFYISNVPKLTIDSNGNATFANRVSAGESFNSVKNGADTVADGPFFGLKNAAGTRQYINQLDASNNIDYWYYNGSAWTPTISLLNNGGATFAGNVDIIKTTSDVAGELRIGGILASDNLPFGKINFANTAAANSQTNDVLAYIAGEKTGSSNRGELTFATSNNSAPVERLRIDSSGIVNIGTATGTQPSYFHSYLNVQNNASTSDNASITITAGSSGYAGLHFGDSDNGRIGQVAYNNSNNSLLFTANNSTRMTIDSSGNVGIGVTPFTNSLTNAVGVDLKNNVGLIGYANAMYISSNAYYNSGWKYRATNTAALLQVGSTDGTLTFRQAASGTADAAISFEERFKIDSSGNVGIANSNPSGNAVGENGKSFIVGNESATAESASISIISGSGGYSYLLFGDGDGFAGYQGQVRYQHSSNNLQFVTGAAEKMRISSLGVVSVGTTSPITDPFVSTNQFQQFQVGKSGVMGSYTNSAQEAMFANNIYVGSTYNTFQALDPTLDGFGVFCYNTSIQFKFADTQGNGTQNVNSKLTIDSASVTVNDGDLFLGATSSKQGTAYFWSNANDSRMSIANTGSAFELRATYLSTAGYKPIDFYTSDSLSMRITSGGQIEFAATYNNTTASAANMHISSAGGQIFRSTSSLKYKTDVRDYDKGLNEVMQLQPKYYKGKNDGDTQFAGLIAEDVNDLGLSEFVQYAEDGTPDALAYTHMVALLVKSIQELKAEIEILKNK